LPLDACDLLLDIAVGHRALGLQIPGPVSVAYPAHRLGEDMDLQSALTAVRLRHGGDPHIGAGFYVGERTADNGYDACILFELNRQRRAIARLDREARAVDALDRAAHAARCLLRERRALSEQSQKNKSGAGAACKEPFHVPSLSRP